jgi:hypothetical protein
VTANFLGNLLEERLLGFSEIATPWHPSANVAMLESSCE